jgi:hypothetical protein
MSVTITRGYAKTTIARVMSLQDDSLSTKLAKACVAAKLPPGEIAALLGTTRATLNTWFKGTVIRDGRRGLVHKFTQKVNEDLESGRLPVKTREEGVEYLRSLQLP